jgi:DNA-binding protein
MPETKLDKKISKEKTDDNTIFIGTKPFMNYVTAVVMQVTTRKQNEVKVVARGKFTSKAIDVVEVARKRFLQGTNKVDVKNIEIGSEEFNRKDEDGREKTISVSTIEITIVKESNQ